MVKREVKHIHPKLPSDIEYDDLVSAGIFAIEDCIENFDQSMGVKFEDYCLPIIRQKIVEDIYILLRFNIARF